MNFIKTTIFACSVLSACIAFSAPPTKKAPPKYVIDVESPRQQVHLSAVRNIGGETSKFAQGIFWDGG